MSTNQADLKMVLAFEAGQEDGRRLSEVERAALKAVKGWRAAEIKVEELEDAARFDPRRTYEADTALRDARDDLGHRLTRLREAADALSPRTERVTVGTEEALSESRPVEGEGFGELAYRLAAEGKLGRGE